MWDRNRGHDPGCMSTFTTTPTPRRTDVPGIRAVTVATGVLAAVLLVCAGLLTYDYNTYTGDDPLIGLDALFAIAAAVPAVSGLVLLGLAWLVRRRLPRTATGFAHVGLAVVALPVGLVALAWLPFTP
jgi:hypothetical protein